MATATLERSTFALLTLLVAGLLTACDDATGPTDLADAEEAPLVAGQVTLLASTGGAASPDPADALPDAGDILVSVEGSDRSVVTDAHGRFELDLPGHGDRLRLRFRRDAMDHVLALDGVAPGDALQLDVRLGPDGAAVAESVRGRRVRFGGHATFLALEGLEPRRILGVSVQRGDRARRVAIFEARTRIHPRGDLTAFDDLLRALRSDVRVRLQGFGIRRGSVILAVRIRADI